jgi:hypothetical protein
MTAFLASLKADLVGRRLLPLVALVALALVGGVAYAVLGGGSSAAPSSTPSASLSASLPSAPVSLASPAPADPHAAVSETTSGAQYQRSGPTRNPFTPLPEPKAKVLATASGSSTSSSSASSTPSPSTSGNSGGGSGGGATTPSGPTNPKPEPPKKKVLQKSFQVALLFGIAPPPGQNPQLVPYENLTRLTPLPDKEHALLVYSGVSTGGDAAVFTLLQEAIVKGQGTCLPSETQCEMIKLGVGKTEELQYLSNEGQTTTYLLQVVSIVKHEVTSTPFAAKVNKAGSKLLRKAGLAATEDLRFLPGQDVVVYTRHPGH